MKPDISHLIPQKPPMVMLDEHVLTKGNKTTSSLTIRKDNLFCSNDLFTEPGLIENIAQTAALRASYIFSGKSVGPEQKPPVGYIGGIKKLIIHFLPKVGDTIQTTIEIEAEIMNVSVARGTITCGNKIVAECEMKIFLDNEPN